MSEAEKEFTELKEHIKALCAEMNEAFANTIGNEYSAERKNQLLHDQNEAINFLKNITDSTINQVIQGIKMGELMTNGGNKGKQVN